MRNKSETILVVGGAGFIGSHVVKELLNTKRVVVLDNLSTGHRWAVDERAIFIKGDLGDVKVLKSLFSSYSIDAVMHFAASSLVGESMVNPIKYYMNNVSATLILLNSMLKFNINKFIFSSTAATYGIPTADLVTERTSTNPINPYGKSKLMVEKILEDLSYAVDMKYIVLRYFNAAGAHPKGDIGEDHEPETHLIPIILQHLLGQREQISVFGSDYGTRDGTCIRDYIHVMDLANAHILALEALLNGKKNTATYNLGNGMGYSVKEVIEMCERVTGKKAKVLNGNRRPGDPAKLVASSDKINVELGWKTQYSLFEIISTAWNWEKSKCEKLNFIK